MNQNLRIFLDFFSTDKRAARLARIRTTGKLDHAVYVTVVYLGKVHDMWFNPRALCRTRAGISRTENQ